MVVKKRRTRVNKVPEGHTVSYHEELKCVVCKREFWGACAWDAHWPCKNVEFQRKSHELYGVPGSDVTFYKQGVKPYVLLECKERYCTMMDRVAKARGDSD